MCAVCGCVVVSRFIIVACDGLWKRFTNESAIEFVDKILKVQNSCRHGLTLLMINCLTFAYDVSVRETFFQISKNVTSHVF